MHLWVTLNRSIKCESLNLASVLKQKLQILTSPYILEVTWHYKIFVIIPPDERCSVVVILPDSLFIPWHYCNQINFSWYKTAIFVNFPTIWPRFSVYLIVALLAFWQILPQGCYVMLIGWPLEGWTFRSWDLRGWGWPEQCPTPLWSVIPRLTDVPDCVLLYSIYSIIMWLCMKIQTTSSTEHSEISHKTCPCNWAIL